MPFLSEAIIFLLISVAIMISGYFIINQFHLSAPRRFELLVSYLGGLSVLLVIYNLFTTIQFNSRVEKNRMSYNTLENIQRNYLMPQKELIDRYPEGYFLYASMNQDTDLSKIEPREYDPVKREQVEVYMALRTFQSVEDFLSTGAFDITGNYVWINNFLMWFQSPTLQKYWPLLAFNYAQDTRALVERVIVQANKLRELRTRKGKLTGDDYDAISMKFDVVYR